MSEIFSLVDYIGTFVFAVTGASIASRNGFDLFGMLFMAFLTSVGGGTVRDLIISSPVFWSNDPIYLYLILAATTSTFFINKLYEEQRNFLLFLDTLGMGTFVVIGTHKTQLLGFNEETSIIMGTMSAVLGGILRSAFSKEFSILVNRELYALVAIFIATLFVGLRYMDVNLNISAAISVICTFVLRYLAIKYQIKAPIGPQ